MLRINLTQHHYRTIQFEWEDLNKQRIDDYNDIEVANKRKEKDMNDNDDESNVGEK